MVDREEPEPRQVQQPHCGLVCYREELLRGRERRAGAGRVQRRIAIDDRALERLGVDASDQCRSVGTGSVDHTLVKRLTGNTWSIDPSPDPASALQASLHGVECTSATACVAVGYSTAPRTLVEQYG